MSAGKHNLYRRNGTWWFCKTHKGKKIRTTLETSSLKEACQRRDNILNELSAGRWNKQTAKTFNDSVDRWIDVHLSTLKPKSVTRYKVSLVHLLDEFDGLNLEQITSASLSEFEARRRKAGASNPTIRRDLACLSSLLTHAQDWEWTEINQGMLYLRKRGRRGLKESPAKTRYLSELEEKVLLAQHSETSSFRRAVAFAIDTGLRKEEQFSLLKSDIDLAAGVVRVRREVTKSALPRSVPLLPRARDIAAQLLQEFDGPYLFVSPAGTRYSPTSRAMYDKLRQTAKAVNIATLSWHDLRRSCGCRLLNQYGMQMHEVSAWLGHSSIKVTEKAYAFMEQEKLSEAVQRRRA